ncbi:hypothetical protein BDV29DRAFT_195503 [Aspergillus leporis]|uniref:DUF7703 domain-containing protein n=1 Tax=Aspergillus leporis TaxID=41062 RepID=A0A5N5WLF4_9EURO|nr:hypothetical protein BDV29DRAFT_195503 [Aspergillus leporis]
MRERWGPQWQRRRIVGAYQGNSFAIKGCTIELIAIVLLLVTAGLGIIPDAIGLFPKYFALAPLALAITLTPFGWCIILTGQSLVLYSRLNVMVQSKILLRSIIYLSITDTIIFSVPQIIVTFGSALTCNRRLPRFFNTWGKNTIDLFIVATLRLLRLYPIRSINVITIMMNISLLVLVYLNYFLIQSFPKTVLHATRLK